jgi:hypothetical protein
MPSDKTMQEVWRWKDEAARDTESMTTQELIAYYKRAERRLAEKTGTKLELQHATRRHK